MFELVKRCGVHGGFNGCIDMARKFFRNSKYTIRTIANAREISFIAPSSAKDF